MQLENEATETEMHRLPPSRVPGPAPNPTPSTCAGEEVSLTKPFLSTGSETSSSEKKKQKVEPPPPPQQQQQQPATAAPPLADKKPAPALAPAPPPIAIPDVIVFRKSADKDDFGFRAVLEAATNPQLFSWVSAAFRVTVFVSLPMFTLAIHPKTMFKLGFPQMLIASVISTSTFRPTLGEQIGLHSWTWRGIAYMLVLGSVFEAWDVAHHVNAWWGLIATGVFLAGLCTHSGMRRFFFLYFFVYMMELRMFTLYFGGVPVGNAAWLTADLCLGTFFGICANLFPYPVLTSDLTDMIMGKIFEGMGKMLMGMQTFLASPMVHAGVAFYSDASPFQRIEEILAVMPSLLWFANWEPWQFPIRNPIRRLKLSLLSRIMALTYAAFSIGQEAMELRRDLADMVASQRIRMDVWMQAHGPGDGTAAAEDLANLTEAEAAERERRKTREAEDALRKFNRTMKEVYGEERATEVQDRLRTLRANTNEHLKAFTGTLMTVIGLIGTTENTPESLVRKVPFAVLAEKERLLQRNRRLEMLHLLNVQAGLAAAVRKRKEERKHHKRAARGPLGDNDDDDGNDGGNASKDGPHSPGSPDQPSANISFDRTASYRVSNASMTRYHLGREAAMELLEFQDVIDSFDIYLVFQEMLFAMLLCMIADELISFGEMMEDYKPARPLHRRLLDFFVIEPWNDFWNALWSLLTFSTPSDIRVVKDAIKMTCAFLSACAMNLEIWIPTGGMYFFGTTILLGLPVEEESLGMSVNRMAGNTLGCALGYLAYNNTKNLSEKIGLILSFAFVCQCARNHPVFGQCFFYAGVICMAGMVTALNMLELLIRVVASCYTVMAYMLCCMFIFPTNPIKVLWNYRMKLSKTISETLDDVAMTARLPILYVGAQEDACSPYGKRRQDSHGAGDEEEKEEDQGELVALTMRRVGHNDNGVEQMLAQLNVGLTLTHKLLAMCTKWTPFAATYPVIRGAQAFPRTASAQVHGAHVKMVASLRLLVFGIQLLHRPRTSPPHPGMKQMLSGSVADFLDDFCGTVRLIFQNFIDSLQCSRTWAYPTSLLYHGTLMRLRVRLRAILLESYILVGIPIGRGTLRLDSDDVQHVVDDQKAHQSLTGGDAQPQTTILVEDDAAHSPGGEAEGGADGNSAPITANASFVDRYLLVRRAMEEGGGDAGPEPSPHTLDELHRSLLMSSSGPVGHLSMSYPRAPSGVGTGVYQHRSRLMEEDVGPREMFPFAPEDVERDVADATRRQAGEESAREAGPGDHPSRPEGGREGPLGAQGGDEVGHPRTGEPTLQRDANETDGGVGRREVSAAGEFPVVRPTRTPSRLAQAVSRLTRPHEEPGRAVAIPKYAGPGFSYREDELDLPVDTDFIALVAILSSCGTFIEDVLSLAGPVNTISGYQKQLHESSLCLGLLDKLSDCVKGVKRANYERYHHPPPPPEKRGHLNAQTDIWREWRF